MNCVKCGADHDDSLGSLMACLRAQAIALGADYLAERLDTFEERENQRRETAIRRYFAGLDFNDGIPSSSPETGNLKGEQE